MSRNNDVFQVLVAKTALVTPATPIGDLAVDQIGIFDSQTNESVDPTKPPKEFYLAVGVNDGQGGATLADINKSSGQMIQRDNVRFYQAQPYSAGAPEIVEILGFNAKSDTEFGIKLEFRNQKIYNLQGYNQFSKTYIVKTPSCDTVDGNELVRQFVDTINADKDGLVIAEAIAGGTLLTVSTAPTVAADITVSIGDVDITAAVAATDTAAQTATKIAAAINAATTTDAKAVALNATVQISNIIIGTEVTVDEGTTAAVVGVTAGNAVVDLTTIGTDVVPGIRITTNPLNVYRFCDINLMHFKPRETVMIVSLTAGFECSGTVEVTQDVAFEQGAGYDVKQREYKAGGWNGKPGPYRVSEVTGTAKNNFRYFADTSAKYHRINLTYDQFSIGGWQEYLNNLATEIYFPVSAKTEVAAFIGVLEAILPSGFESQAAKFA